MPLHPLSKVLKRVHHSPPLLKKGTVFWKVLPESVAIIDRSELYAFLRKRKAAEGH